MGRGDANRRQHGINTWMSVALLAVVALTPLPIGSVMPASWAMSAAAIAMMGIVYAVLVIRLGGELQVTLRYYALEAALLLALAAALVVQILPLGPVTFALPDGSSLTANRLSLAPGDTLLMLMRQAGYAVFFFLTLQVAANRRRAVRMLHALLLVVAVYAVVGLVSLRLGDTLLGLEKTAYQGFATATFVNRNSFATFLAAGFAVGVASFVGVLANRPAELWRVGLLLGAIGLALIFIVAALWATGSRMGLIAALSGGGVILAASAILGRGSRWLWGGVVLVLVFGGLALSYGTGLLERVIFVQDSLGTRLDLYRQVWEMIVLRPWFGYGGGSFPVAFPLFQHPPVEGSLIWEKAHSTYLTLWLELGLVAGSLPMIVIILQAMRALLALRDRSSLAPSLAAIGTIVVFGVHALVDFSLEIQADAYLFLAIVALGSAGFNLRGAGDSGGGRAGSTSIHYSSQPERASGSLR